jgi:hypothetical protein
MTFDVLDAASSYGIPSYDTQAVQQADLAMLVSTGAQCVRVDIGFAPWLAEDQATISLVDSVVNSIRSDGKCLIIADASSESYRNGGALLWSQFKAAWMQRVSTLAARYHPAYYIVVKEPGWYVPFVSDASTNPLFQSVNEWLGLTQNLTNAVKLASPNTQVGVAVSAGGLYSHNRAFYVQYLNQVQAISGLSFIGFDIYGAADQSATQTYVTQNHPTKPLWIAETWSNPSRTSSAQAQSDAAWMKSIYQFGQSMGVKMMMPFYTDLFSGYSIPTGTNSMLTFYQGRTPVYAEFCNVVAGKP